MLLLAHAVRQCFSLKWHLIFNCAKSERGRDGKTEKINIYKKLVPSKIMIYFFELWQQLLMHQRTLLLCETNKKNIEFSKRNTQHMLSQSNAHIYISISVDFSKYFINSINLNGVFFLFLFHFRTLPMRF